eukprot:524544-Amphidinium_carterae.1
MAPLRSCHRRADVAEQEPSDLSNDQRSGSDSKAVKEVLFAFSSKNLAFKRSKGSKCGDKNPYGCWSGCARRDGFNSTQAAPCRFLRALMWHKGRRLASIDC